MTSRRRILSPWLTILGVVSALALGVVLVWISRPVGLLVGAIVVAALVAFFVVWFVTWTVLTTRARVALLEDPGVGEGRRLAWFYAALLGYPVLSVAVVVLVYGVARSLATG
jgi:hypothetical protein